MRKILEYLLGIFISKRPLVPVLTFNGVIGTGGFGRGRINAESLEKNISKAFSESKAKAVAIIINSPGGSPVQSSLIYQRVRYLAEKKDIPRLICVDNGARGTTLVVSRAFVIFVGNVDDEVFALDGHLDRRFVVVGKRRFGRCGMRRNPLRRLAGALAHGSRELCVPDLR